MLLKDLTLEEKRNLIFVSAHSAGQKLSVTANNPSVNNDHDISVALTQFRDDLNRLIDLIEEMDLMNLSD